MAIASSRRGVSNAEQPNKRQYRQIRASSCTSSAQSGHLFMAKVSLMIDEPRRSPDHAYAASGRDVRQGRLG